MESFSLFELNEYIRRVIALNFQEPIWVHAEISQVSESRGHWYLELIEKSEDSTEIKARSAAVIWYNSYLFLQKKLNTLLNSLLQPGTNVRWKVQVEFHERYGLKLTILDIDPKYTLGQLELQRQETLERLKKENLLQKNSQTFLPLVLQRIAIISSSKAAGYSDFMAQLNENALGYTFKLDLFETAVQGKSVRTELQTAFDKIGRKKDSYDCVVLIRGGGSKIDLSAFDEYSVGKDIALCPLPVITGIGHEVDQSIADICAHTSLKTPTAVAEFLIQRMQNFENALLQAGDDIRIHARKSMERAILHLQRTETQIHNIGTYRIERNKMTLAYLEQSLHSEFQKSIQNMLQKLGNYAEILGMADPIHNLKKGFAIVRYKSKILKEPDRLNIGDELEIQTLRYLLEASIKKIKRL